MAGVTSDTWMAADPSWASPSQPPTIAAVVVAAAATINPKLS